MEPILTCRNRMNEQRLRALEKERLRTPILLNLIFAAGMLGLGVYLAVTRLDAGDLSLPTLLPPLLCLAFAGFLIYEAFTIVNRTVAASVKNIENRTGKWETELIVEFYPDCFYTCNRDSAERNQRQYEKILEIVRGTDWISLHYDTYGCFILDPARFESGTEADFWTLMNRVCPKAVPPRFRKASADGKEQANE